MRISENSLDPYLLRVFSILLAERSVSRTALQLNQSQPAISAALKQLRLILGDPLLVREKGGMVPTARALALVDHANGALAAIDHMTGNSAKFDPSTSQHVFKVGVPDYLAPTFFARLVAAFRRDAPNATISMHSLGPEFDFERALTDGSLEIVIGNWPEPPDDMHRSTLIHDEIVCLVDARHPLAKRTMTIDDYQRATHIVPLPYAPTQRGLIDTTLAAHQIERKARIVVQSFKLAPLLLQHSDLVFTTTRHFARFFAPLLSLSVVPPPIAFPKMPFYQLWHDRNHQAAAHRWLRDMLAERVRGLDLA